MAIASVVYALTALKDDLLSQNEPRRGSFALLDPECRELVSRKMAMAVTEVLNTRFDTCAACKQPGYAASMVSYLRSDSEAIVDVYHKDCVPK